MHQMRPKGLQTKSPILTGFLVSVQGITSHSEHDVDARDVELTAIIVNNTLGTRVTAQFQIIPIENPKDSTHSTVSCGRWKTSELVTKIHCRRPTLIIMIETLTA